MSIFGIWIGFNSPMLNGDPSYSLRSNNWWFRKKELRRIRLGVEISGSKRSKAPPIALENSHTAEKDAL